jgi:hypothetical protein
MHFLRQHVLQAEQVALTIDQPVNPHENVQVIVVRGWR